MAQSSIQFYCEEEMKEKLLKLAKKEDRNLSNYIRMILKKRIEKEGL